MQRLVAAALAASLGGVIVPGRADEPANRPEPRTYTVSCKVVQKVLLTSAEGKAALETIESKVPNITTLEGTRGEHRGRGLQLFVKLGANVDNKVRLTLKAEANGALVRVVRQVQLGRSIKVDVDEHQNGETVWLELTVQETPPDLP